MTASYVKGTLPEVHVAAFRLSQRLVSMGFSVSRVKIESTFSNPGVPRTDAEAAALSPHNYFEFHWKLRLPSAYDHAALAALVGAHGARLSRSALRHLGEGFHHRFVTLRLYDMGRDSAARRLEALSGALEEAEYELGTIIREYAVCTPGRGSRTPGQPRRAATHLTHTRSRPALRCRRLKRRAGRRLDRQAPTPARPAKAAAATATRRPSGRG